MEAYETINTMTGEIEQRTLIDTPAEGYRTIKIREAPVRAKEAFRRINIIDPNILDFNEKAVYYGLTELITWGNNFVQDNFGSYASIAFLTKHFNINYRTLSKTLASLETKQFIALVGPKNKRSVYLYSRYVWLGYEKDRSDNLLKLFIEGIDVISVARKNETLDLQDANSYCTECNMDAKEILTIEEVEAISEFDTSTFDVVDMHIFGEIQEHIAREDFDEADKSVFILGKDDYSTFYNKKYRRSVLTLE